MKTKTLLVVYIFLCVSGALAAPTGDNKEDDPDYPAGGPEAGAGNHSAPVEPPPDLPSMPKPVEDISNGGRHRPPKGSDTNNTSNGTTTAKADVSSTTTTKHPIGVDPPLEAPNGTTGSGRVKGGVKNATVDTPPRNGTDTQPQQGKKDQESDESEEERPIMSNTTSKVKNSTNAPPARRTTTLSTKNVDMLNTTTSPVNNVSAAATTTTPPAVQPDEKKENKTVPPNNKTNATAARNTTAAATTTTNVSSTITTSPTTQGQTTASAAPTKSPMTTGAAPVAPTKPRGKDTTGSTGDMASPATRRTSSSSQVTTASQPAHNMSTTPPPTSASMGPPKESNATVAKPQPPLTTTTPAPAENRTAPKPDNKQDAVANRLEKVEEELKNMKKMYEDLSEALWHLNRSRMQEVGEIVARMEKEMNSKTNMLRNQIDEGVEKVQHDMGRATAELKANVSAMEAATRYYVDHRIANQTQVPKYVDLSLCEMIVRDKSAARTEVTTDWYPENKQENNETTTVSPDRPHGQSIVYRGDDLNVWVITGVTCSHSVDAGVSSALSRQIANKLNQFRCVCKQDSSPIGFISCHMYLWQCRVP